MKSARLLLLTLILYILIGTSDVTADANAIWQTLVTGKQSEPERLATVDLQRYLAQVTGVVPAIVPADAWQKKPAPAVLLGTPDGNVPLKDLPLTEDALGEQGYCLDNTTINKTNVVLATGRTPAGAVNAIYGLLRELGYRFYLGSESIPASLPPQLPTGPIHRKPVFAIRGVLPWYNFFNSPTVWDPIDHRAFADQLIRGGANFVGFHTYDTEPFAAYDAGGKMAWGSRLLHTGSPTWGTAPLPTRQFAFGIDRLFADDFFGAATTLLADPDEAIRTEQRIMRDALNYAHQRGLKTCLGFEISGDPLKPADRDVFLRRINLVLDAYPAIDYLWIWQPETQGVQGFREQYTLHQLASKYEAGSPLRAYAQARCETFRRIVERTTGERPFLQTDENGKVARATEGARLEQFAMLGLHAIARRERGPKLVISGWGGDERLLSAEYYDGLDKLLPKDVVFSSLDHIFPRPRVDTIYNELPSDRQRWPIPWLELDGDQWHRQPWVHVYEKMVHDAHRGGSQGILGIHWRTRDVEENFAYLVDYAWNPDLTAEGFFKDIAQHGYPAEIADEMAKILNDLDAMGYRWIGGNGQTECGGFGWGPGDPNKVKTLQQYRDRIAKLLPKAGRGTVRLRRLLGEIDWVLAFDEAQQAALGAANRLDKAARSDPEKAIQLATEALALLDNGAMTRAMRTYAGRTCTRGEYGVLATINTKAIIAWRDLRAKALKLIGQPDKSEINGEWKPEPTILLPRLVASTAEHQDLELSPIVFGDGKAWTHSRRLGDSKWTSKELTGVRGWVYKVTIPAAKIITPGIEIGFSFSDDAGKPMVYGPIAITVMPSGKTKLSPPARAHVPDHIPPFSLTANTDNATRVEIRWPNVPGADYYRVYHDDKVLAETAVLMFPGTPMTATATYRVEAIGDGIVVSSSAPLKCTIPDRPIAEKPENLQVAAGRRNVTIRWSDNAPSHAIACRICRQAAGSDAKTATVIADIPVRFPAKSFYVDTPGDGDWLYSARMVNLAGSEGPAATAKAVTVQPTQPGKPVLDLPLASQPAEAVVEGNVRFDSDGANTANGFLRIPHQPEMNIGTAFTLDFEFRLDQSEPAGMPVLLSHGLWQADGWFVQILNGSLIVRTPRGDANGPAIEPGKWYKVRFVYDGQSFHLSVNGRQLPPQSVSGTPTDCTRDLIIGQYDLQQPHFAFKGRIRNVRMYNEVLGEQET